MRHLGQPRLRVCGIILTVVLKNVLSKKLYIGLGVLHDTEPLDCCKQRDVKTVQVYATNPVIKNWLISQMF